MADPQISDDSSSGEAEEMQEVVIGDTTIRREEHILDRTGQNIGDPETELADLSPDLLEVDYTNTRLRKLPPLKHLHQVESLNFRQNLLQHTDLQDLQFLTSLTSLDLYDNRLTSAQIPLAQCTRLVNLDLSFNLIPRMEEMGTLVNLQDLWFASNAIKKIRPCLVGCTSLRTLELGFNRVKRIENLESLTTLQNLWLGRNRIRTIENLSMLINLQKLDVQSNRLTKIEGLSTLVHLEQLYLSHNRISRLENLETLTSLRILDVSNNHIAKLENLTSLVSLEDLWINHNRISTYEELAEIAPLPKLTTVYLEGNPMASDTQYRVKVLLSLPRLEQLDATEVHHPVYMVTSNGIPHARPGVLKPSSLPTM